MIGFVSRVHVRKYTDLLMHLLRTTPDGVTNTELASDLCVTTAGAKRVARKLEMQGRIVREMALRGDEYLQVWKAKKHA